MESHHKADSPAGAIATVVPADDLCDVAPESLSLKRWSLRFFAGAAPIATLERAFQARQSKRFRWPVRIVTAIFFVANFALVYYDWSRFVAARGVVAAANGVLCGGSSIGNLITSGQVDEGWLDGRNSTAAQLAGDRCSDARAFGAVLTIRLAVMLPLCLAIIGYTFTPWYSRSAQPLALGIWMLGNCLIAYSVVGRNPGYGVLALLILYIFSFTPVNVFISGAVCSTLIVTFGVALGLTRDAWAATVTADASDVGLSMDVQMLNILGVLASFMLIVGFIGHNLEFWLRQSFLDEVRLQVETLRLREERQLSRALLTAMLPEPIIAQLQAGRHLIADTLSEVTVLFAELQFDTHAHPPVTVVTVLNLVYSAFDALIDVHRMHKIETVGHVYLCAGGCPEPSGDHAVCAADMALAMLQVLPLVRQAVERETGVPGHSLDLKVGLNSGPCAAGVVGIKNPRYKLVGDTVNTASRMESTCVAGRIQMSQACRDALERSAPGVYVSSPRGIIEVKGKGAMFTYWLHVRSGKAGALAHSVTAAQPAPAVLGTGPAGASATPSRAGAALTDAHAATAASDDEDDVVPAPSAPVIPREARDGSSRGTGASNLTFYASRESGNSRVSAGELRMFPASADFVDDGEGGLPAEREASRPSTPPAAPESYDSPATIVRAGPPCRADRDGRASSSGRALTAAALAAADSAAGPYSALEIAQAAGHVTVRKKRGGLLLTTAVGGGLPGGQPPASAVAAAGVTSGSSADTAPTGPPSSVSDHPAPAASFSSALISSLRHGAASLRRNASSSSSAHPRVSSARFQPVLPTLSEREVAGMRPSLARPPIVSGFAPDHHHPTASLAAATHGNAAAGLRSASSAHWVLAGSEAAPSHDHSAVGVAHDIDSRDRAPGARQRDDDDMLFVTVDDDDDDDDEEEQALAGFFDAVNQERYAVAGIGVAPGRMLSTLPSQRSMVHGAAGSSVAGEPWHDRHAGASSSSGFEGPLPGEAAGSGPASGGLTEAASDAETDEDSFNRMADMINGAIHDTAVALGTSASVARTPSVFTPQTTRAHTEAEGRHATAAITPLAGSFSANRSPLSRPLGRPLDRTRSQALFSGLASPRSPPALLPSASLRFRSPLGPMGTTSVGASFTGNAPVQTDVAPLPRSVSEDHVVLAPRVGGGVGGGRLATVDERLSGASEASTLRRSSDGAPAAACSGAALSSPAESDSDGAVRDGAEEESHSAAAAVSHGKAELLPAHSCDSDGRADALPSEEQAPHRAAPIPTSTPVKPLRITSPSPHSGTVLTPMQYGHRHGDARADHHDRPAGTASAAAAAAATAAAHATKDAELEIQLAKRHDMLALCLNISSLRGPSAKWERLYQHTMRDSWTAFLRTSVVVGILAIVLFAAQDYVKYRPSSDASAEASVTKFNVWATISIARYAVILPSLIFFLATTYTHRFATSWAFSQFTTVLVILTVGGGIIAISILGRDPGYGVLALYLVYCLNFSVLALALRIVSLLVLVAAYILSALLLGNTGSVTVAEAGLFLMYLAVFTLGESVPVVMREAAVRQNFFRRRRIEIETRKLHTEELRTNKLLANLLPPSIVPRLRGAAHTLIADAFDEVTILWTDMKGFTSFSSNRTPMEVVTFLNAMFSTFDRILDKYGIQKVEVLGDAFFVVGGCPEPSTDHAERCVNAALEMQAHMPILRAFAGGADISMRVGVHTGPVVAGVVGAKDPRYHLFGATVPHANLMESSGEPGRVHISWQTHNRLQVNQEARARVFVDAVRTMFSANGGGSGSRSSGGGSGVVDLGGVDTVPNASNHGGDDTADGLTLETQTPASHSVDAYPRVSLARIDALLREVAAAERQQHNTVANSGGGGSRETSSEHAAAVSLGVAASEVDSGAFDGSRGGGGGGGGSGGGGGDATAAHSHPPSAAELRARRRRAVGGSARSVDLSVRVVPLQSAEQLVDESATSEEGITVVPEEGEGAVRGQVQLWRRGAFLGWDIQTNLVQNDFIYSRSDLPLMLALAPVPVAVPMLAAAPITRLQSLSSMGPAGGAASDAATGAGSAFGRATILDGGPSGAPPSPPRLAAADGTGRGVSFGGLFTSRSLSAHHAQQCATVVPDEHGSAATAAAAAAAAAAAVGQRAPVNPGEAARRAFRERHKWTSVDTAGVTGASSGDGGLLSGRNVLSRSAGGGGPAAPAAPGSSMLSSRVLLRTMSTIEKAAHGLAGRLDYARSEIYRALVGRLRGARKADEPAAPAASDRRPLGPYKPDDPVAVFGPGAGFFAFEERAAAGPGLAPTYFVTRADPPLLPELASAIKRLDEFIVAAAAP